jgi:iron complex transport system permease protein
VTSPLLKRGVPVLAGLVVTLAVCAWLSLGFGPSGATWSDVPDLLDGSVDPTIRDILVRVRLPRVFLAALVGAALSGAGVVFQAVLRNPLADPYILGVSGGAALGAVLFTALLGSAALGSALGRPGAAFAGALATLFFLSLARVGGRTEPTVLLLVGVVLNAFYSAVILFLLTAGDASRFRGALFYLVGSMASASSLSWPVLGSIAVFAAAGLAFLLVISHRLNLLAFGEEVAGHLGVDAEKTVWVAVAGASLITAAAVAFTGLVGFVGLIVPHLVRTLAGPDHRLLLPASALGGAAFLVLADTVARTVVAPGEMPVGVVTALVGGPFFLFLFLRYLRER